MTCVTVTVAADSNCSRADGGKMILSPLREGVDFWGSTSSWADHFSDGGLGLAFMVVRKGESQKAIHRDVAFCTMERVTVGSLIVVLLEASVDMSSLKVHHVLVRESRQALFCRTDNAEPMP